MTIYSKLRTLSNDRYLKYMAVGSVLAVTLSLLTSALSLVSTTAMVLVVAALIIKLIWEITNANAKNRTD
tara:strand:- start:2022 stop:2231 length:210 start_codon:yes stop_codon:yes gene_type:complete